MQFMRGLKKIQYLAIKRAGKIPKSIPLMCVLVVKNEKNGKPIHAKSCILVLENFEDRLYQNSQCYTPVLKYISFRVLTIKEVYDK